MKNCVVCQANPSHGNHGFFLFPSLLPEQQLWIKALELPANFEVKKSSYVCFRHFLQSDIQRFTTRHALKKGSVPAPRSKWLTRLVWQDASPSQEDPLPSTSQEEKQEVPLITQLEFAIARINFLEEKNAATEAKLNRAKKEVASLKCLTGKYRNSVERLLKDNPTKSTKERIVREVMSPFFSDTQVSCFLKKDWQRVKTWSQSDIQLGLTLRLLHRKTFEFLRRKKLVPLPGDSTLRDYFKNFKVDEGFLSSVARLVQIKLSTMTQLQRVTALSIDEIHLRSDIDFDQSDEQIVGPFCYANVMMARGIFNNWKLPVWFRYKPEKVSLCLQNYCTDNF